MTVMEYLAIKVINQDNMNYEKILEALEICKESINRSFDKFNEEIKKL